MEPKEFDREALLAAEGFQLTAAISFRWAPSDAEAGSSRSLLPTKGGAAGLDSAADACAIGQPQQSTSQTGLITLGVQPRVSGGTVNGASALTALPFWRAVSQPLTLFAPCCHHDIQSQLTETPEPWSLITRYGIMRERLADLLTDALRMQILKIRGYRVEAIEFIGGEHTPRNLMIRAVKTGATVESIEVQRYEELIQAWKVKPALARLLNH